eukprot:Opistho-1_new@40419
MGNAWLSHAVTFCVSTVTPPQSAATRPIQKCALSLSSALLRNVAPLTYVREDLMRKIPDCMNFLLVTAEATRKGWASRRHRNVEAVLVERQLSLPLVPPETPAEAAEPVGALVAAVDGGHGEARRRDADAITLAQLLPVATVERRVRHVAARQAHNHLDLDRVRHKDGAERERVRTNGRQQDRRDRRVHHRSARANRVRRAARWRSHNKTVALHRRDELSIAIDLEIAQVRRRAPINHHLIHHLYGPRPVRVGCHERAVARRHCTPGRRRLRRRARAEQLRRHLPQRVAVTAVSVRRGRRRGRALSLGAAPGRRGRRVALLHSERRRRRVAHRSRRRYLRRIRASGRKVYVVGVRGGLRRAPAARLARAEYLALEARAHGEVAATLEQVRHVLCVVPMYSALI